ncbi:MAG TPA: hypothetical protein VHZ53_07840 [Steroidobacteraceae bacterium]|jgi:hypothetical protein|nr:hypothetical protein [Steroidobacteraceae bacterium]
MRRELHIEKLNDEFGQFRLALKCGACGHERLAAPSTLAKICGWDANLADVAKRMRCSHCGKRDCTVRAVEDAKPRGWQDPRR